MKLVDSLCYEELEKLNDVKISMTIDDILSNHNELHNDI
jgi:hypothetical protein